VIAHDAKGTALRHQAFHQPRHFQAALAPVDKVSEKDQRPAMRVTPTFTDIIPKCNS
jgi:hypothetical protein